MFFLIGFFGGSFITLAVFDIVTNYYPEWAVTWAIKKMKKQNKIDVLIVKDL